MATDPSGVGLGNVLGGAAALGGLFYTLGKGESPIPTQATTVSGTYAPTQFNEGQNVFGLGAGLEGAGAANLSSAMAGNLTPEQQAVLSKTRTAEENQAYQMYESMGITPGKDTSFLSTQGNIDVNLMAAANQFVQTNIMAAFGQIQAGTGLMGLGAQMDAAAAGEMMQVAQMQFQDDQDYANAVAGAFKSIAGAFSSSTSGKGTTINLTG